MQVQGVVLVAAAVGVVGVVVLVVADEEAVELDVAPVGVVVEVVAFVVRLCYPRAVVQVAVVVCRCVVVVGS
jgi:hypothetical protein